MSEKGVDLPPADPLEPTASRVGVTDPSSSPPPQPPPQPPPASTVPPPNEHTIQPLPLNPAPLPSTPPLHADENGTAANCGVAGAGAATGGAAAATGGGGIVTGGDVGSNVGGAAAGSGGGGGGGVDPPPKDWLRYVKTFGCCWFKRGSLTECGLCSLLRGDDVAAEEEVRKLFDEEREDIQRHRGPRFTLLCPKDGWVSQDVSG